MADILTDLEGILGVDAVAKLRGNEAVATRLSRASELVEFYDGESTTPPAPPQRREPPPASGTQSAELSAIMTKLEGFGDVDKKIADGIAAAVKTGGAALHDTAVADAVRINRELSKLDARHRADFGEELDDDKLRAHVDAAIAAGRPFRTVPDAYEDMTREARVAKQVATGVETGVREKLKERASGELPGVTPSAASPMLRMLKTARTGTGNGSGNHLDAAGAALAERLADNGTHIPA